MAEVDPGITTSSTTMHGEIVESIEEGWVANMTHPERVSDVILWEGEQRITRGYANPGARTRMTDLPAPDEGVKVGDRIVASVATVREKTGRKTSASYIDSDGFRIWGDVDETRVVASLARQWGLLRGEQ